ncbi:MAG TPA: response regulator [Campylobacterales bacterium]|nr:response regulator [Campylobacterales bacterium]
MAQTILIVEDSKLINKFLKNRFEGSGYICDTAFTLKEAIDKISKCSYDFITLDLHLPDGEGDELLESISRNSSSRIIALTAIVDKDRRDLLFKNGVLDYFSKDSFGETTVSQIISSMKQVEQNANYSAIIIDDSVIVTKTIKKLLEARGYEVFTANSGADGLEIFNTKRINIAVIDLEMPDMGGIKVLESLKRDSKFELLPVLMLSATTDADIIGDALKKGAVDFLRKPYIAEELIRKVGFWIDYNRKFSELKHANTLLSEYKKVIDKSTIVSKTNLEGIITFANDKFCDISGYNASELIGKPHNIIRHPDMPKEAFEDLWQTIQAKYVWHGIVKNRRKDGSSYIVDSIVTPILDENGEILEFISVRYDITQFEEMKNDLQNKLGGAERTLSEMMDMSSQYEAITEEVNMILKIMPSGKIIYANQKFCDVSGYHIQELLGETFDATFHPEAAQKTRDNIWQSLARTGSYHGVIKCIKKDGSIFWIDSVIKSIVVNKNLIEYIQISKDITEILALNEELEGTQREILYRVGEIGETRNKETGHHVKRVAEYSKLIAQKYGLSEGECKLIFIAAPMHDIGKVGIPDNILLKPDRLDEKELKIMQTHSEIGAKVLSGSKIKTIEAAAIIAAQHHEKYDGTGYPLGLKGDQIHIFARIVAIADVFDALGSDRPYKKAWGIDEILSLFHTERGKQFDPLLTDIFLNNIDDFLKIKELYKEE